MKEKDLQEKLIDVIHAESFDEFIEGREILEQATRMNSDDSVTPFFSIDNLLKKRYCESAKRVLNCLDDYEIISGMSIKNISLNKQERIYPDIILFNRSKAQLIIIENKTSANTEREAITELLSYAHEIRNHLPFLSNYDINYILVATDFNTLLDHSVAAQILSSDINFLCLKPQIDGDLIRCLNVHIPCAWEDIGQAGLPDNALMSYTLCLNKKEGVEQGEFDVRSAITVATDLILHNGNNFRSSGFYITWANANAHLEGECRMAVTIYILNPLAFLPDAIEKNFPLNPNSVLSKYLINYRVENGMHMFPSSLFDVCVQAKEYLERYFDVEWDRSGEWILDTKDKNYCCQRKVLQWDSWGAIGDFVRSSFLHPANERNFVNLAEEQHKSSYLNPFVGLQTINRIAGNYLFKAGNFSNTDIAKFGTQLGNYLYACRSAKEGYTDNQSAVEANLFWTALPLMQSLKDIMLRVNDSVDLDIRENFFAISYSTNGIRETFEVDIKRFVNWFKVEFINETQNPTLAEIFQLSVDSFWYTDHFYKIHVSDNLILKTEQKISDVVRRIVVEITTDRMRNIENNLEILQYLNTFYFDGKLHHMENIAVKEYLVSIPDSILAKSFESTFCGLLDLIKPELHHHLRALEMPESVDWEAFYKTAVSFFNAGNFEIGILIGRDGTIGLGVLPDCGIKVTHKDEILVSNRSRLPEIIRRVQWSEILNRTFQF